MVSFSSQMLNALHQEERGCDPSPPPPGSSWLVTNLNTFSPLEWEQVLDGGQIASGASDAHKFSSYMSWKQANKIFLAKTRPCPSAYPPLLLCFLHEAYHYPRQSVFYTIIKIFDYFVLLRSCISWLWLLLKKKITVNVVA